jgi:fimbrial chaperone protein
VTLRTHAHGWIGACLLATLPVSAPAGTFTISPLRVDFGGAARTAALTVRNDETVPVVVQADALAWSQESGEDDLAPSHDLLVSPAVFTLAPGGSQLVRVALRREADVSRELAYRLTLQEVPQAAGPGFTGLQVALRLSVPVFVAPRAPAEPQLAWSATRTATGAVTVTVRNQGAAHARLQGFALKTADGRATLGEQPALAYVLPGATRRWSFDDDVTRATAVSGADLAGGPRHRLEGTSEQGAFVAELALTPD